jgi:DeoR family transcriptional regulator of aga operon
MTRARSAGGRLLVEERRRRILELLATHHRVTVNELSSGFGVSAVTVRGDLDALAEEGHLVRSHGGGLARLGPQRDLPLTVKETLHRAEKQRIGRTAAALVREGETVILDSGTTTAEIARHLRTRHPGRFTVITNGLNVAAELCDHPHLRLIVIGGLLRQVSHSMVGPQAEHMLAGLRADRLFLGVDGLDPDVGMLTPDVLEAQLNALMIRVSREVTVVADSSKFSARSMSVIGTLDQVHRLVTDTRADAAVVASIRARGVDVLLV